MISGENGFRVRRRRMPTVNNTEKTHFLLDMYVKQIYFKSAKEKLKVLEKVKEGYLIFICWS
jgi:hypothetical protein